MKTLITLAILATILLLIGLSAEVQAELKTAGVFTDHRVPRRDMPVAVRYGWSANPRCNLSNKAGLPASPFGTDSK